MNVSAVVGSLGAVVGLTSLPDGGLVVAAHDPPLMRLNREGKYIWVNTSSKLDFRDPQLAVSEDGTIVDFRARGMPRLRFDLTARRLSVDPPADRQTISTNQSGLAIENWKNDFFPTVDGEPITLDPDESSRSLAIYPDNGRFVLGADRSLRAFEARGQPIWRHVAPSVVWAVNISGNGRLAIAAYDDGTIRWHRMDDGRELLALYVFPGGRQEWVAWTPEGFYDATADVFGRLQWQVNRDFGSEVSTIPVNAIARLRRPDVLALVLQELETAHVVGIPELKAARRDVQIATGSKSPPGPRLHVLTIGISAYGDKAQNLSLKFASRDAQDVANAILNTQSDGLYAEIKPMFLHDDEADKGGIYDALAAMDRNMMGGAGQDLAVILFSGHGTMIDNRFYLLPYGADSRTSARLKASAIPATELKSEIEKLAQQGRVLVLLDACRSAGLIGGPSNTAPAADMLKSVMNAGNVTVLTSSTADRVSHEDEKWGHGAFTKTFLDALSPSDDVDPNHDGVISMSELTAYLDKHLKELTDGDQQLGLDQRFQGDIFVAGL
jgi:Caspase domain